MGTVAPLPAAVAGDATWHDAGAAVAALASDAKRGLSSAEAARRLRVLGPNRLAERPPRSRWLLLLDQFRSVLLLVLIGAAALSALIGEVKDVVVIVVVVVLNALLGFVQEARAEAALVALKRMLSLRARTVRDGAITEIPAEELVPGDVVALEAGDRVPADGRLLVAPALEVDESSLTGESAAVAKAVAELAERDLPLADRLNMVYLNTAVTHGRARMLVTATGMQTEMGRLALLLQSAAEAVTPLQRRLDQLGRRLAVVGVALVGVIFALDLLRGEAVSDAVADAIAVAVASIPEGLPTVVTVTLALGMYRLARRGAIVKRLAAVETLGSTTVICSDKTGTLTLNEMTAREVAFDGRRFAVSGEGYIPEGRLSAADGGSVPDLAPLLLPAALCNDSDVGGGRLVGDPTEGALLVLADKFGFDRRAAAAAMPRIARSRSTPRSS